MDRFYQSTTPLGVLPAWGGAERPQRGGEARPLGCWRPPRRSISRPSGPVPVINRPAVLARPSPGDQSGGRPGPSRRPISRGRSEDPNASPSRRRHPSDGGRKGRDGRQAASTRRAPSRLAHPARQARGPSPSGQAPPRGACRGAPLALRERHDGAPAAIRLAVSAGWMAAGSSPTRGSRLRPLPR